ncbi:MAG: ATP-binding protein [Chloroflexota bacterium]|nr:ATP-binding protein [Chloroflexota bacterium]
MTYCDPNMNEGRQLRSDQIAAWIKANWTPRFHDTAIMTAWTMTSVTDRRALDKLNAATVFEGYRLARIEPFDCPVANRIDIVDYDGDIHEQTGAFSYHFTSIDDATQTVEVLLICAHFSEPGDNIIALAAYPTAFLPVWTAFARECNRLAYLYEDRVVVIGGRQDSFVPMVDWAEIVLPARLKADIMEDVAAFFKKGVEVYRRLNLKPFRKLLFAGVPGTGKTMLCNALAKWGLEQKYLVIYISSAKKGRGDQYGSTFNKIQQALDVAANSERPAIMILEELDAYLHDDEKALILNVLDGSESIMNERGTLLLTTTNYPEAIDERVMKRPGRLDRVFIVPQTKNENDATAMLQRYLGAMWNEAHRALVARLVGYSGAFIREVAIHALTQVAYDDLAELPLALLMQSFDQLKTQIEARDDFLKERGSLGFGAVTTPLLPVQTRTNGNHD